jgi:hypothetical protein
MLQVKRAMTMTEKILANRSDNGSVKPGKQLWTVYSGWVPRTEQVQHGLLYNVSWSASCLRALVNHIHVDQLL